jgi:hypothetical protein
MQRSDENRAHASEYKHQRHRQRPRPRTQRRYDRDRERDEAQSPDPDEGHKDPGIRRAVPAELAYVLADRRVMGFESAGEYPPPDEHDLGENCSPRQQPRPATRRIGQQRPPCRSEPKCDIAQHGPLYTSPGSANSNARGRQQPASRRCFSRGRGVARGPALAASRPLVVP